MLEGRNGKFVRVDWSMSIIEHVGSAQGPALLWWGKEETLGFVVECPGRKEFRARRRRGACPEGVGRGPKGDDHQEM